MGGGSWTASTFNVYTTATKGSVSAFNAMDHTQIYKASQMDKALNPYGVMRECKDTEEHPNTIPVILALDVTGSMGDAAAKVAKSLNEIMEELYKTITDVEFLIAAVGDLSYDNAPFQAGQFESDIRIAEQTDKIYFESGGGGNKWESYTAAWYFGLFHTQLDCWARNKKGIIITLGDEPLNPYLPGSRLAGVFNTNKQSNIEDVDTKELYKAVSKKFDIYHISVKDSSTSHSFYEDVNRETWSNVIGSNYRVSDIQSLAKNISNIIIEATNKNEGIENDSVVKMEDGISW